MSKTETKPAYLAGQRALARALGFSPDVVADLVRRGIIPVVRPGPAGKKQFFDLAAVRRALEGGKE